MAKITQHNTKQIIVEAGIIALKNPSWYPEDVRDGRFQSLLEFLEISQADIRENIKSDHNNT